MWTHIVHRFVWPVLLILTAGCVAPAESSTAPEGPLGPLPGPEDLDLELVASGLYLPVGVLHAPGDQFLYIVQKDGKIIVTIDGIHLHVPALDLSNEITMEDWEQGLLDATFHPDWPDDPRVFVRMTPLPVSEAETGDVSTVNATGNEPAANGTTGSSNTTMGEGSLLHRVRIVEYTYNTTNWLFDGPGRTLLEVSKPLGQHNAGSLVFGPDGHLYAGMGEGGFAPFAQNRSNLLGSIIRIDVSGPDGYTIPPDNPYIGDSEARPELWQIGVRNPWKLDFDGHTGDLWFADVGGSLREEINVVRAGDPGGRNFGWGVLEGNVKRVDEEPDRSRFTPPIWESEHFTDDAERYHCATIGGVLYRGQAIPALWGTYVYGDLCAGTVWALAEDNGTWDAQMIQVAHRGLSGIEEDAEGEILLINHDFGTVRRLVQAN